MTNINERINEFVEQTVDSLCMILGDKVVASESEISALKQVEKQKMKSAMNKSVAREMEKLRKTIERRNEEI